MEGVCFPSQEEPEESCDDSESTDSLHPSIVPLTEVTQSTEDDGKLNYITVHYARMPRWVQGSTLEY